jgi:hypothetical protein
MGNLSRNGFTKLIPLEHRRRPHVRGDVLPWVAPKWRNETVGGAATTRPLRPGGKDHGVECVWRINWAM